MASERSVPVIDLSLLKDHREELISDLKHALLFWGFFYIENYDDLLDDNIIQLVVEQGGIFFDGSDDAKRGVDIVKSRSFSGFEKTSVGDGQVQNFHSHYPSDGKNKNQLTGSNNFPEKPILFEQSTNQLIDPVQVICKHLNDLILESLTIYHTSIASKSSKLKPEFAEIHLFKSDHNTGTPSLATFQSYDLFKLIFNPPKLNICDVYGSWVESPSKSNQIAISIGPILEYLSKGIYISGKFKFTNQVETHTQLHYRSFYNLDFNFKTFDIPEELEIERQERDKIPIRKHSLNIPKSSTISQALLNEKIIHFKNVSQKWYPDTLKHLENELNQQNASRTNNNNYLIESIEKANSIFSTFDKIVPHLARNRSSDIKLSEVLIQMKKLKGFTVTEEDLLKVATIWVDALCFKLNEYDDIIIDSDKAKDEFQYKNFTKRKEIFESKSESWISQNKHLNDIPIYSRSKLESPNFTSSTKRVKREILQNSKEKFQAKPKTGIPASSSSKTETKGLTLLERIKLKEQQASENKVTPEIKYDNFLQGKLKNVLQVVLSLKPNTPYKIDKLSETLQNSLTKNPIGEKEAYDCTLYLNKKFPHIFKLVETSDSKILKWDELDREELLSQV
ncbi:hypothetical protein BN7_6017 [Wickerhamomyces ciferrii]|uniref:Uncharacterized protein n=1 Tax=Wickerhamomyces ciferrii (strain ATCC 14091 / BCRC 22168 / CBS 111 / JCM 3599 / NBRC 0793 / NRRL Y-1031 F-60-10) TaxID=1206466 RepID=K0KZ75_WICCF|nr:uncharacterized protein BN7_6017 [Wickerhamomyces ciferrii]CCH46423.1 hypothetical protein BN7_6017 [Wickerhamomyces ciferrii]